MIYSVNCFFPIQKFVGPLGHGSVLAAAANALRAAGGQVLPAAAEGRSAAGVAAATGRPVHGGDGAADADLPLVRAFLSRLRWPLAQCSMFAAWGSRVDGGGLLSGRNLDWTHDTGINRHKLVTVYHPPEPGRHAHATFGFGGLIGALAAISAAGLTTHEANLESNRDTFKGFPWLLRLRHVLV